MKYFVLKPEGTTPYHYASRAAMYAYAGAIEDENPTLALDLLTWAGKEAARVELQEQNECTEHDDNLFHVPDGERDNFKQCQRCGGYYKLQEQK
jgi:hypothetical protein